MNRITQIILAVVVLAITAFYFLFNPTEYHFYPKCVFSELTGYQCFGCGGQRAFHALLHGRFEDAFHLNFLIYLILPVAGIKLYNEAFKKDYWNGLFQSKYTLIGFLSLLLIFSLIRNFFPNLGI